MDKKERIVLIIAILIILIILLFRFNNKSEKYIQDSNYLYDVALEYLKEQEYQSENHDMEKEGYHFFASYDGLGITKKDDYKYAYMWILGESYYLENGEVKDGSAYSMFFKFTFKDDKVVKMETPEDGSLYTDSIKKMCPDKKLADKVLNYNLNFDNKKEVDKYYSKITNSQNLEKEDIKNEEGILFSISYKKSKCVPVSLTVYDQGKYELYNTYEACKPGEYCNDSLKYTDKLTGKYDYDVMSIIKNSKNADYMTFETPAEYEIYTGKSDYIHMMITDSNNEALKEFLKSININLQTCATPDYGE